MFSRFRSDGSLDVGIYLLFMLSYALFSPVQELIGRCGVQAPLFAFLKGSDGQRHFWSIVVSNMLSAAAHAHLNLLGWVSLSIFGVAYHIVPAAGESILAKIHAGLSIIGVIVIVPGIVMAIRETGEALAKLGSVLCVAGMLVFLFVLLTKMRAK